MEFIALFSSALFIILYLALWVIMIVANWIIFKKAGKPGWACIIPIYNILVLLQIVDRPWWWILLMLIPGVNVVIGIIVYHNLSLSFGQGIGFTFGLLFLGIIFFPILAFGSAKYVGRNPQQ